jgi:hypothetical protein
MNTITTTTTLLEVPAIRRNPTVRSFDFAGSIVSKFQEVHRLTLPADVCLKFFMGASWKSDTLPTESSAYYPNPLAVTEP